MKWREYILRKSNFYLDAKPKLCFVCILCIKIVYAYTITVQCKYQNIILKIKYNMLIYIFSLNLLCNYNNLTLNLYNIILFSKHEHITAKLNQDAL